MQEMMEQEARVTKTKQGMSSLSEIEVLGEVGRGGSGVVYKVRSRVDQVEFAMKRIQIKHLSKNERREALKEVSADDW